MGDKARRNCIRTTTKSLDQGALGRLGDVATTPYKKVLGGVTKKSRRRLIRFSILAANVLVLVGVLGFVLRSPNSSEAIRQNAAAYADPATVNDALDQVSSADIAVNISRLAGLPEAVAVTNQADSFNALISLAPSADSSVIAKPQVVSTALKSRRDIQKYKVQAGENVSTIAAKFGITSDSIRWSNAIAGDNVAVGREILVPPVSGIVYKVNAGDTADSLARKFFANSDQITAFNDAEVGGLPVGEYIVIPDGRQVVGGSSGGGGFGGLRLFGGGGYDAGWCTAYAAARSGAPGGWGNANTWHIYAPLSGWTVSTAPRVGAIAQNSTGWAGHVGIVEAVSPDGTMIKYSDMNGLAGFNRVGYSDWVPVHSKYQRFIYR